MQQSGHLSGFLAMTTQEQFDHVTRNLSLTQVALVTNVSNPLPANSALMRKARELYCKLESAK